MSDTLIIIVPTCSYTNNAEETLKILKEFEADHEYYLLGGRCDSGSIWVPL